MDRKTKIIYPNTDEIDPQQALFLYEQHCAIVIVENLMPGTEFGVDMFVNRVGQKFKGIKLIPPGIHFIYASPVDKKSLVCGPRSGFFHDFKEREILIKKWSEVNEDFDDSWYPTEEQIDCYRSNLRDLDRYLSPYKFSTYQTFLGLTNELSRESLEILLPDCKKIRSVPYNVQIDTLTATPSDTRRRIFSKADERNLLPNLQPDVKTVIHFSDIHTNHQSQAFPVRPSEVTEYTLDSTLKLDQIFAGEPGRRFLIQQFQLAFITFLLCHVYECFEQWKRLLSLVCLADSGLSKYPEFYLRFITCFEQQLQHVPEDLFEDIVDDKNLIRTVLDTLFQNIEASTNETCRELKRLATRLKTRIQERYGWQFDIELDDERPVVVELN